MLAGLDRAILAIEGDADQEEHWLGRREAEELGFLRSRHTGADVLGEPDRGVADVSEPGVDPAGPGIALSHGCALGQRPGDVGGGELHGLVVGVHAALADEGLLSWSELEALDDLIGERELSAEQVAGYIAKYATRATEALGVTLDHRVGEGELDDLDVPAHVAELVRACFELGNRPSLMRLRLPKWTHMLGFGGHFSTKSRRYSTTLGRCGGPE